MASREEKFIEDVTAFNHELTVAAVRADFDKVKTAIAATFPEVATTPMYVGFEMMAPCLAALQVAGSDWTLIVYAIGCYSPSGYTNLVEVSKQLKADALIYVAEDTSGEENIEFYREGDRKVTIYADSDLKKLQERYNVTSKKELTEVIETTLGEAFDDRHDDLKVLSYAQVFELLAVKPLSVGMGENGELYFDADAAEIDMQYAAFESPGFRR